MTAKTNLLSLALALLAGCASTSGSAAIPEGTWVGEHEEITEIVTLGELDAAPERYYDRQLFVEAYATAVCQKKGCWMALQDGAVQKSVRWESGCGGRYVFPDEAIGKRVVVQGMIYPRRASEADADPAETEGAAGYPQADEDYELNATAVMVVEG